MVPTATNEVFAPRYADTYEFIDTGNPFRVEISEDAAFGDVMVSSNGTRAIRATQYRAGAGGRAVGSNAIPAAVGLAPAK